MIRASRPPIGLDLGTRFIHAAQADRAGKIIATATMRRLAHDEPHSAEDFDRLCGALYRRGFRGREVIVTAPKSIVQRSTIELPPKESGAPLDEIARGELARQTQQAPSAFEFTWWDAPQPPRHGAAVRAIALSSAHEQASALLDAIEQSGLKPVALFTPSTAAAVAVSPPAPGSLAGVLDLGWSEAVFVLRSPSEITFERRLNGCEISRLVRTISGKHHIDPGRLIREIEAGTPRRDAVEDFCEHYRHAVRDEMRSSIDYLRTCDGRHVPMMITVLGGGALVPGIIDEVSKATEIPACPPPAGAGPALAVAAALATPRGRFRIGEAA